MKTLYGFIKAIFSLFLPIAFLNGFSQNVITQALQLLTSLELKRSDIVPIEMIASDNTHKIMASAANEITRFAPNPTNSDFDIIFSKNFLNPEVRCVISNSPGSIMKEEIFISESILKTINLEKFNRGIYFVTLYLQRSEETIKYKLVKE
jgi:hypothetical protein